LEKNENEEKGMHKSQRQIWMACVIAVLMIVGNGVLARGQSIRTGKISGTIIDDRGDTLPGVSLEITSPALISGKRAAVTTAKGTYVFLDLPVGTYKITASLTGFKTIIQEDIKISAGSSIVIDLALPMGSIAENVTVTAASPVIDVKTSTIDAKLESQMLDKLPTSRDAFYDLSLVTPGMFDHGSSGGWLPSPTAYGGASNENVFLVNGVNATNPRGASFGTLVRVNYNAIEEVRVVALGSKAEYGSYSGAGIDVLTKSGSNTLHGTAAFYVEPVKWRQSNQPAGSEKYGTTWLYVDPADTLYGGPPKQSWEGNFTMGGPIVKDRVWFYGGFDYIYSAGKRPRWDLLAESWGRYGDIKISAEPLTRHRAWVSYHYESNDYTGGSWGSQPQWDTSMTYGVASKNNTVSAQWQWLPSSTTILTAKYLGFWTNDTPHVPSDAPANPGYINWWKWASYGINGAFPYIEGWHSNRQTVQVDVSHYAEDFLGEHDIKFGAQFTRGRSNSLGGYFQNYANFLYPYRWTQNVNYMQSWYGDTGLVFYNLKEQINPFMTVGTADSLGFFFDDQWSPTKRLTVNVGLRYDRMTTKYGEGEIYMPLTKPTDIGNPTVLRKRKGTDNIFDFKTISPRIGLTYSLTKDGKTVARASYGRYYLPLSVEYLRRYGPDCPLVTRQMQMYSVPWDIADANGDNFIDTIETRNAARHVYGMTPYAVTDYAPADRFSWTLNVDPNLKDQYTDQITLNLEREIFKDFSVSVTYIYKHAGNIFANIPINRATQQEWEYDRVPFTTASGQTVQLYSIKWLDYNGDGVIDGGDIRWIGENSTYKVVNMGEYDGIKPKRDYMGFQLVFNKRYSNRWQLLGSVLYSISEGMANRIFGNSMNAEGPMFTDNTWMGSLNYTINNLEGPLPFTPKLEFKLSGSYTIPYIELDLGARFRLHTGRPIWTLEAIPVHSEWANPEGGVIDAGGVGSIVSGDPNKPEYLPTQTLLDLRMEKSFKLAKLGTLSLILDIFNVFNAYTPTSVDNQWEFGKVGTVVDPRSFRFSFLYRF
jgi:outer membrane receptor protein involved in Fe transport